MTIISTVNVPEGIAMAADSRTTRTITRADGKVDRYPLTDNAQKLVTIKNSTVGISFCGDAFIDGKTVSDFIRIFDINQVVADDTVEEIANKLYRKLQEYTSYSVTFIICGYDNDEPFVYRVSSELCVRTNIREDSGELVSGASWDGDHAKISAFLKQIGPDYWKMPLKDAIDYAEFIVELTIKQQRFSDALSTCGGPIDLLVITKDYTKFLKHKILNP
ncbi:hypothetical protein ABEX41_13025 [Bacillus tropicus]|uniref:Uncharacterized protein n=1 Tax=Bacillus tropicus TaxID=2026188 RepID=A0A5C5A7U2_9BACI|nr:hypothetical protein [Bacillus tropicus]ALL23656.1 hypothetical protein BTXL6_20380 [Bacillus thuringiensis]EEM21324.1 hypothetical protein bthur0001_34800 [Bacillus thuringiensis serovar tochigiensis BGSC 4Y1]TNP15457.1 hypothetical protein FHY71_11675 [Bacillus tropicus]